MNIIFDVDETLYDMTQPFQRAFEDMWKEKYKVDLYELYTVSRIHSDRVFDKVMAGEMTVDDAGVYRMQHAMHDFGFEITEKEAMEFQKVYRKHQKHLELSRTMEEILNYLKDQKITLGILTNGDTDHQMEKIRGMQLERWFSPDHIFVSDAIGYFKPDIHTFQYVEKSMGLNKKETWYIGDSIENDVEGAGGAGWHVILLNRRKNDTSVMSVKPEFIVDTEEELLEILEKQICPKK